MARAIGAIPALLLTVTLWGFVGHYAVLAIPATLVATYWLIEGRSRKGLQQRTYEQLDRGSPTPVWSSCAARSSTPM